MFIICRLIPMECFIFHDNVSNVFLYHIKLLRCLAAFTLLVRLLATLVPTLFPARKFCVVLVSFCVDLCMQFVTPFYTLLLCHFTHYFYILHTFCTRTGTILTTILGRSATYFAHGRFFFAHAHILHTFYPRACVWQQPCAKCVKCRVKFYFAHVLATRAYGSSPVQSVQNAG